MSPASPSEPTRRLRLPVPVGAKTTVRGRHAVRRMAKSWAIGACVRPDGQRRPGYSGCAGRGRALAAQRSLPPVLALNIRSRNRGVRRQAHSIYARHHAPKRRRRFRRQRRAPTRRSCPLPSPPSFLLCSSSFLFREPSFLEGGNKKSAKPPGSALFPSQTPGDEQHTRAARAPGDAGCGRAAAGSGARAETNIVCGACVPAPRPPAREDAPGTRDGAL